MSSIDAVDVAALSAAVVVAAMVQGAVGIGFALVSAPVVALVDTDLLPGLLVFLGFVLPTLTFVREARHTRWAGLGFAVAGRVPGTVLGVLVVAAVDTDVLAVVVAAVVLGAVALTWSAVRLPDRPVVLAGAGLVSGVTGTAVGIDGPPVAIALADLAGPALRATMSAYFVAGGVLSLVGLALGGELHREQAVTAVALLPAVVVGFLLSGPLRRHVDAGRTRLAVLLVCAASAVVLLVRVAVG